MSESKDLALERLGKRLDEMRDAAVSEQQARISVYQDGFNYLFDNQLVDQEIKDGWDPIQCNVIFPAMMQELAIESQRSQTILAMARDGGDRESSKVWQGYLRWLYERELKFNTFKLRALLDGKIYGHYIGYPNWNPRSFWDNSSKQWRGAPELALVNPERFAADPECDTIAHASYAVMRRRVSKDYALWRWPHASDVIEGAVDAETSSWIKTSSMSTEIAHRKASGATTYRDMINRDTGRLAMLLTRPDGNQGGGNPGGDATSCVNVEQFIFRDYQERKGEQTEEVPVDDLIAQGVLVDDGGTYRVKSTGETWPNGPVQERSVRKYDEPIFPCGRVILRINGEILNPKEEDQIWPYKSWPFIVGVNHLMPHVWWGMNAVVMAKSGQDWINRAMRHVANWVNCFGDQQVWAELNALPGKQDPISITKKLKSAAGKVVLFEPGALSGQKVRRESPPAMGSGITEALSILMRSNQDTQGMHDIGLGQSASGNITATEALSLATNSKLRSALSNKNLDDFTTLVFEHLSEICQHHLKEGDFVRVSGEAGVVGAKQITSGMKSELFDLALKIGTELPFDKDKKQAEYMNAYKAVGVSMLPELLDALGIDEKDEILSRHTEYQAFLQYQQQATQQPQQEVQPQSIRGAP